MRFTLKASGSKDTLYLALSHLKCETAAEIPTFIDSRLKVILMWKDFCIKGISVAEMHQICCVSIMVHQQPA